MCELSLLPCRVVSGTLGSGRLRGQYQFSLLFVWWCWCQDMGLSLFIPRWRMLEGGNDGEADGADKRHTLLEAPDL